MRAWSPNSRSRRLSSRGFSVISFERSSGGKVGCMDHDSVRDEAITEARIAGTSARALAKVHGCTSSDIEAAVDRRLDYGITNDLRLRLVKLNVERLEQLMAPFFEWAVKDRDVAAGTLCYKLAEPAQLASRP